MKKTTEDILMEIDRKLGIIISLISIQGKDIDTQIRILKKQELEWNEIGMLVGLTADAARKRFERS